jgi:hypothetical protein
MATVNWWLDITEELTETSSGNAVENIFYVGPFPYTENSNITIQEFMDDINAAFITNKATDIVDVPMGAPTTGFGKTLLEYTVSAQVVVGDRIHVEGYTGPGAGIELLTALAGNSAQNRNFVIQYKVAPTVASLSAYASAGYTLNNTIIRAWDGIHGAHIPATAALGEPPGSAPDISFIPDPPYAEVTYTNASNTILVDVPSSTTQAIMLDSPPLPPDFRIFPYLGVNNRLMLMFNSNTGEYRARPQILKPNDVNAIADLYLFQENVAVSPAQIEEMLDDPTNPIKLLYKNDDPIKKYEIYRIRSRPSKYSDFGSGGNPIAMAHSQVFVNKDSSAASFIDTIAPNTRYYYCARAVDVHGNFSNPTHVFEVELVDNEGQTYLILNTIYLNIESRKEYSKKGRRYLYVEPALRNLTADEGDLTTRYPNATTQTVPGQDLLGDPSIGSPGVATGPDVWNKTFKIRLTSLQTSKKIDLNITFKNTGVDYP